MGSSDTHGEGAATFLKWLTVVLVGAAAMAFKSHDGYVLHFLALALVAGASWWFAVRRRSGGRRSH